MAVLTKDKVNLDALIPRQDLELSSGTSSASRDAAITAQELATKRMGYQLLRKPHFQRETDDWSIDHVVEFIRSFAEGALIPAIILWRGNGTNTFVIDGAHRLSAIIAWVNDDYGDQQISAPFYGYRIPKKQREIAEECRRRVNASVGSFASLNQSVGPTSSPDQLRRAQNIASVIATQTVPGDARKASAAFLAINQRAVQIDPTERYVIEYGDKPNVLAARAIVSSARGYEFWKKFEPEHKKTVEEKAKLIYAAIYEPEDAEPDSSVDLQPAGRARDPNGLRIALSLVNQINATSVDDLEDDTTGAATAMRSGSARLNSFPRFISGLRAVGEGAELSTAAVGACDEPADAVGNSGRTSDLHLMRPSPVPAGR